MAYLGTPGTTRGMVTYDERGRPYMMVQGRKSYVSPMAMGAPAPEDSEGQTFLHQRPRWNQETGEWDRPINWGNVLSAVAGGGIAAGGLSAAGVFGGAGGGGAEAGTGAAISGGSETVAPLTLTGIEGGAAGLTPETAATIGSGLSVPGAAVGAFDPATGAFLGPSTYEVPAGASTFSKIAPFLRGGARMIGAAGEAGEHRRLAEAEGQSAFETALIRRALREEAQRTQALKDVYRQSYTAGRKPGPFNAAGLPPVSPGYTEALSALEQQGLKRLRTAPQYGTDVMPALSPQQMGGRGGRSTLSKIGEWVGPGLEIGGLFF